MEMLAGGFLLALVGIAAGEPGRVRLDAFSTRVGARPRLPDRLRLAPRVLGLRLAAASTRPLPLVATYAYVNPVVAVLLGWTLLDEPITPRMILAGGIIVVAVALIAGASPPPVAEDEPAARRAATA